VGGVWCSRQQTQAVKKERGKAIQRHHFWFECLNIDDKDMLDRFLSKLFVNDV
jgi:hypothetical protein